jgi:hypothetical protein
VPAVEQKQDVGTQTDLGVNVSAIAVEKVLAYSGSH